MSFVLPFLGAGTVFLLFAGERLSDWLAGRSESKERDQ